MGDAEGFDEPSVQPPTREQIAEAIWDDSLLLELPDNLYRVDRVLALFQQPTPSDAPPHTPFCVRTSTPDNPCRCWKSGSTDEED